MEFDDVIEKFGEPENIESDNISRYKFNTDGMNFPVEYLVQMLDRGDIIKPKIQRNFVWKEYDASRFIESILLDLPLPSIFLAKTQENKYLIIDGLQRLTSIQKYLNGEPFKDGSQIFKLANNVDIQKQWRGQAFKSLTGTDQRMIKQKTFHVVRIETSPRDQEGLYHIFERLNTGGTKLNQQELRNSIYQSGLNDLLFELNDNKKWRELYGQKPVDDRFRDIELILRFFAMSDANWKGEVPGNVKLLNNFMECHKKADMKTLEKFKTKFESVINSIYESFDHKVFMTFGDQKRKTLFVTIYDSLIVAMDYGIKNGFKLLPNYKDKLTSLHKSKEFEDFALEHTTTKQNIFGRINLTCNALYGKGYGQ